MSHYKSNLREIAFQLFDVLEVHKTSLGVAPFVSFDRATAESTLEAVEAFVQAQWAPSFAADDRAGTTHDGKGNVTLPTGLANALRAYYAADWHLLDQPEARGGMGAPPSVAWAAFELIMGGNAAACFYTLGGHIAKVIDSLGTEEQRRRFVPGLLERHWGGTMVLTEPDAGSDVGSATSRARQVDGDVYELTGVKRFITSGDFDTAENIIHLVLARPEGAVAGTKGLSMFIVPKYWVEADGTRGARNGMFVTNVEHKMGLRASATCEMTMGGDVPCRGWLVGGKHDGIAQMFQVIEFARMAIGAKSIATLSTAYLNALDFARERKQGADLTKAADKHAPRVTIINHPDVRRMLMLQKAFAEGLRGLLLWAAHQLDQAQIAKAAGAEAKLAEARVDLVLPLLKGYSSEKVYELLSISLQCLGGSGYLNDYPHEQYIRDQKIDTLYEGTTHIQALDLLFRKVARDQGATLRGLLADIGATAAATANMPALAPVGMALGRAVQDVGAAFIALLGKTAESPYHAGLHANRLLFALAEVVIAWRLTVSAQVAISHTAQAPDAFCEGKIAAANFFAREVLPNVGVARRIVEASDISLMQLGNEAW